MIFKKKKLIIVTNDERNVLIDFIILTFVEFNLLLHVLLILYSVSAARLL